ncbi:unnamed protein product, partial [Heterotrigona itama]
TQRPSALHEASSSLVEIAALLHVSLDLYIYYVP